MEGVGRERERVHMMKDNHDSEFDPIKVPPPVSREQNYTVSCLPKHTSSARQACYCTNQQDKITLLSTKAAMLLSKATPVTTTQENTPFVQLNIPAHPEMGHKKPTRRQQIAKRYKNTPVLNKRPRSLRISQCAT